MSENIFFRLYEFFKGQTVILSGISGVISFENDRGVSKLIHTPDKNGRESVEYRRIYALLKSDFISDVTMNEELTETAVKMGFVL